MKKIFLGVAFFCSLSLFSAAWAQTFEINGQQSDQKQTQTKKGKNKSKGGAASGQSGEQSGAIGFGSSLESGRYARAAEAALKRGDNTGAVNYAQHLTQVAPNDSRNWFLLGYTARMAGK